MHGQWRKIARASSGALCRARVVGAGAGGAPAGRLGGAPAAALGGRDKIYGHFPFKTILRAQLGFMSRRRCSDSIYSPIFHTITHTRITSDG